MPQRFSRRGDVWRLLIPSGDPARGGQDIVKWVVVLQGGRYWAGYQSVLVAVATSRQPTLDYPHFVEIQPGDGGFEVHSWINCGDLVTLHRSRFVDDDPEVAEFKGTLGRAVLDGVDAALLVGTGIENGEQFLN